MKKLLLLLIAIVSINHTISSQNVGVGTENPEGEFHVTKPAPDVTVNFMGNGLDDLSVDNSGFTGSESIDFYVRVENSGPNPNLFQWSNDGTDWSPNMQMSTSAITLDYGVSISFAATAGHTYYDVWQFTVSPAYPDGLIVKDGKVGIGTADPLSKLDVKGHINLGNGGDDGLAGDIRYNQQIQDFEGYDGEEWLSLTRDKTGLLAADTTDANSYNMTENLSSHIYVSDSSALLFDDGGSNQLGSSEINEIFLISLDENVVGVEFFVIEGDEFEDGNGFEVGDNNVIGFSQLHGRVVPISEDTVRVRRVNVYPYDVTFAEFKVFYSFVYALGGETTIPQGRFPLYYSAIKNATIGGDFTTTITHDDLGLNSFQWGTNTEASGDFSIAMGSYTDATGLRAISLGNDSRAIADYSSAIGYSAYTTGISSTALGDSWASGQNSTAIGKFSKSSGANSTAVGYITDATGEHSFAGGSYNVASGNFSTALGAYTESLGEYSTSLNKQTEAIGEHSIAMGYLTDAVGAQSMAMGHYSVANGENSTALGNWTIAGADNSLVLGKFNTESIYNVFVIGDGTHQVSRSNLFYINTSGNAWLQGSLTQSSDARLKKTITPVSGSLASLKQLTGYTYYWKESNRDQGLQSGLIAQELQAVFPHLVQEEDDGFLSVNYIGLIPHIIEASKELDAENKALKAEVEELKNKYQSLEDRIKKLEEE